MDSRRLGAKSPRRGFTLVELLVVLVVIGILVGLISAAVLAARAYVMLARMRTEIHDLEVALQNYKNKLGEFPPDFASAGVNAAARAAVVGHLQKAYPRLVLSGTSVDQQWNDLRTRLSLAGINLALLDPSTALPFWLGGLPEKDASLMHYNQLAGFSANPTNPLERADPRSPSRTEPYFRFNTARLDSVLTVPLPTNQPTAYRYRPDTGSGTSRSPYLYFCARDSYAAAGYGGVQFKGYNPAIQRWQVPTGLGTDESTISRPWVYPYFHRTSRPDIDPNKDGSGEWYGRDTFQITCAGLDGLYGATINRASPSAPRLPIRDNVTDMAHDDNVTTFGIVGDQKQ